MRVYLTDLQVPEMAGLSLARRRAIRRGGFELFCAEQPYRRGRVRTMNAFAAVTGLFIAREVGLQGGTLHSWWGSALAAGLTIAVIEIVFQSWLTERLRPYFRSFVEKSGDEAL